VDEQATLNRFIKVIGNSLMEYATRLHNKELVSKTVDQVAIAA
jgi:hypothetical protein